MLEFAFTVVIGIIYGYFDIIINGIYVPLRVIGVLLVIFVLGQYSYPINLVLIGLGPIFKFAYEEYFFIVVNLV